MPTGTAQLTGRGARSPKDDPIRGYLDPSM